MQGRLDLRRLRYFLAIAQCGSISLAARQLNLAQPALSYHLSELERLTGHVLCERGRGGITLTEPGRYLRDQAAEIVLRVEVAERGLAEMLAVVPPRMVRLRIAIISSLAAGLTPVLAARASETLPDVTLHIIESGTRDIMRKLQRGEVDMAVYLTGGGLRQERVIAEEPLYFVSANADNALPLPFHRLATKPLVLPALGNPLRDHVERIAREQGLALDVVLEVDGVQSRLRAVERGIGGTILGAHAVFSDDIRGTIRVAEVVEPRMVRPIFLGAREGLDTDLQDQMRLILTAALADGTPL